MKKKETKEIQTRIEKPSGKMPPKGEPAKVPVKEDEDREGDGIPDITIVSLCSGEKGN